MSAYTIVEFGRKIDPQNFSQLDSYIALLVKSVMSWQPQTFDRIAENWSTQKIYRPEIAYLMVRLLPRESRFLRLHEIATGREPTTPIIAPQGFQADAFFVVLMTSLALALAFANFALPRIKRVMAVVNKVDDTLDAALAGVRVYIQPCVDWVNYVYTKLCDAYRSVWATLSYIPLYLKFMCLWVLEHFVSGLGHVSGLFMNFISKVFAPEFGPLDWVPLPQAGSSWLPTVFKLIFGVSFSALSLPSFKNGASALGWLLEKGPALLARVVSHITGVPYPTTVLEEEIVKHYQVILDLHTEVLAVAPNVIRTTPAFSLRYNAEATWFAAIQKTHSANISRLHGGWSALFSSLAHKLDLIQAKLFPAGRMSLKRPVPVWVNFHSKPGVGKSDFIDSTLLPSIHRWLASKGVVRLEPYQRLKHTFPVTSGEAYFDNYDPVSSVFMVIDDIYKEKDVAYRMGISNLVINAVSPAPWNLPMADMNKKNMVPFESLVVVSSCNENFVESRKDLGVQDPTAVTSRVMYNFLVQKTGDSTYSFELTQGATVFNPDGSKRVTFVAEQVVGLVCSAIMNARERAQEPDAPVLPVFDGFRVEGPRSQKFETVAPAIHIVEPDPNDARFQGLEQINNVYNAGRVVLQYARIHIPLLRALEAFRATPILPTHPLAQFFVGFIGAYAVLNALRYVLSKFAPALPPRVETWGNPDGYTDECELTDDLQIPTGVPQSHDVKGSCRRRNDGPDDQEPRVRRLRPRDQYDADYQGKESVKASQLWSSIKNNIGSVKVHHTHNGVEAINECFMTGVVGHTWLVPAHMIVPCTSFEFQRKRGVAGITVPYDSLFDSCNPRQISVGDSELDLVLLDLPALGAVEDKRSQWCGRLPDSPRILRFYPRSEEGVQVIWTSVSEQTAYVGGYGYNLGAHDMFNEAGMCGLPIFNIKDGTILGIHTAGNERTRDSFFSVAPVEAFRLGVAQQASLQIVELPQVETFEVPLLAGTTPEGKLVPKDRHHMSMKTTYYPSRLSLDWPRNRSPAHLAPFVDAKGVRISPLYKALGTLGARIPVPLLTDVPHVVDAAILPTCPPDKLARIASWEEAAFGSSELGIEPLDLTASVGPTLKSRGITSRRDVLDPKTKTIAPVLKVMCDEMWNALGKGPITLRVAENLKDELRDNDRVALGKTRIFYILDLAFLIVQNRLAGHFASMVKTDPTRGSCAVGINPTSMQWGKLAKRFLDRPGRLIAFDIERYDVNVRGPAIMRFADLHAKRVETEQFRVRNMYASLLLQYHVINQELHFVGDINPSGHILTSILGSGVNTDVVCSYALSRRLQVDLTTYSDDNIVIFPHVNGKPQDVDLEDFRSYARQTFGLNYTAADKTPELRFLLPTEIQFLSRSFVPRDGHWWAPLPEDTIMGMLLWMTESRDSELVQIKSRITSAITEALQHPQPFYDKIAAGVRNLCTQYSINYPILPYYQARMLLIKEHYEQ